MCSAEATVFLVEKQKNTQTVICKLVHRKFMSHENDLFKTIKLISSLQDVIHFILVPDSNLE